MAKTNKVLTEAEWLIIEAVWEHEPCAAPMVQEALEEKKGWMYSTVKTMMDRMVEKGLLKTKRIRNLILYSSAITQSQARTGEVMRTLKCAFNGALTPMMQFLLDSKDLCQEDLKQLEKQIKGRRKKTRGRK